MAHQIFLSVVVLVRNQAAGLKDLLTGIAQTVSGLASDYELIVVDNGSDDNSTEILRMLTTLNGLPNLQVFVLAKSVDPDTGVWAGAENALGDFVVTVDPATDDTNQLPAMLDHAMRGVDVVFAENLDKPRTGIGYRICAALFYAIYKGLSGIDLGREAPRFRVLSRRVLNFVLKHPSPTLAYRYLPATSGFPRASLRYRAKPAMPRTRPFGESMDKAIRMMVASTRTPMRIVTTLSLLGAMANVLYSGYVIAVAFWKADVQPGWVTLSLQQSGMFFLISLVMWVLGEYILQMASLSNEGPNYYIAQEYTSAVMTRKNRLNVDDTVNARQSESFFSATE